MKPQADLYQQVTDRIIEALEAGTRPWVRDWTGAGEPLRHNGKPYQGINFLMLSMSASAAGYRSDHWMTFNQARQLGGMVRKGERGTPIVFFKRLESAAPDAGDGDEPGARRGFAVLRGYTVFNADQIDGLPDRYAPAEAPAMPAKERDQRAEAALRATGARIMEDGEPRAYYSPSLDYVHMPAFELFGSTGGYLATMAHELAHWTGHRTRLGREQTGGFKSASYAKEELIAEMGAAFVCARLGIAGEHIDNHAAYLASWLACLKADKKAIFKAAAAAQAAADCILPSAASADEEASEAPQAIAA